jgi:peroxiredoxin
MKNKVKIAFGIVLVPFLLAFAKPNKGFVIYGTITGKTSGEVYLTHEYNGVDYTDSAIIKNSRFMLKGMAAEVQFYTIKLSTNGADRNQNIFLLDNRVVSFKAVKDSLYKAHITGSPDNDIYNYFHQHAWKPVTDSAGKIYKKLDIANQGGKVKLDSATQKKFDDEFAGLQEFDQRVVSAYIIKHKTSVAAAAIILERFINYYEFKPAAKMFKALPARVQNSVFGKQIKEAVTIDALTSIGKSAPEFSEPDTTGKLIDLKDFKGKYVLVDFWASWCGPCRKENPNVVAAYNKYHGKGFEIISVSLDNNKNSWIKAIQADHLLWTHVSDLKGWKNIAAVKYGIKLIPQNFLLDKDGKIIARNMRGPELDKQLSKLNFNN